MVIFGTQTNTIHELGAKIVPRFKGKKPRDWGRAYKSPKMVQEQTTLPLYAAKTSFVFLLDL